MDGIGSVQKQFDPLAPDKQDVLCHSSGMFGLIADSNLIGHGLGYVPARWLIVRVLRMYQNYRTGLLNLMITSTRIGVDVGLHFQYCKV